MPILGMSLVMGISVYLFEWMISLPNVLMLISQIILGILIYIIEGIIIKSNELNIFINLAVKIMKKGE